MLERVPCTVLVPFQASAGILLAEQLCLIRCLLRTAVHIRKPVFRRPYRSVVRLRRRHPRPTAARAVRGLAEQDCSDVYPLALFD